MGTLRTILSWQINPKSKLYQRLNTLILNLIKKESILKKFGQ